MAVLGVTVVVLAFVGAIVMVLAAYYGWDD